MTSVSASSVIWWASSTPVALADISLRTLPSVPSMVTWAKATGSPSSSTTCVAGCSGTIWLDSRPPSSSPRQPPRPTKTSNIPVTIANLALRIVPIAARGPFSLCGPWTPRVGWKDPAPAPVTLAPSMNLDDGPRRTRAASSPPPRSRALGLLVRRPARVFAQQSTPRRPKRFEAILFKDEVAYLYDGQDHRG